MKNLEIIEEIKRDLIGVDFPNGIKIELSDSAEEGMDKLIAPYLVFEDEAITIEEDGGIRLLDFHDEKNPKYFDTVKECTDYIRGCCDAYGNISVHPAMSEDYIKGYAETVIAVLNNLVLDRAKKLNLIAKLKKIK